MKAIREKAMQLLVVILIGLSTLLGIMTPALAVYYEYTELLPPGYTESFANDINNRGTVAGFGTDSTGSHKVFLYSEGVYTELLPPGWNYAEACSINNNGDAAGFGDDGVTPKGFIYSDGVYTELLPPGWSWAAATGINDNGDVVGYGYDGNSQLKGFIFSDGVYTELLPPGWHEAHALSINNSSTVVGYGYDNTANKGFIYNGGVYTELLPPGLWSPFVAYGINNSGDVSGFAVKYIIEDGIIQAIVDIGFIYSGGQYTELLPPGLIGAEAYAINDSGAVVGYGWDGSTTTGFIYSDGGYTNLLPPGCAGSDAYGINDSGAVVGFGDDGITRKGFIATPITTPIEPIQVIIEFFDNGTTSGNLSGIAKTEQAAAGKLKAFRNMLLQAQHLIENGDTEEACEQLMAAHKKVDGKPLPPDFIGGSAASELAAKIAALIEDLNCL